MLSDEAVIYRTLTYCVY